jgi:hypothetical protein
MDDEPKCPFAKNHTCNVFIYNFGTAIGVTPDYAASACYNDDFNKKQCYKGLGLLSSLEKINEIMKELNIAYNQGL